MHLHRVTRDVYADRSSDAVRIPPRDVSLAVALGDEAVVVPLVSRLALAAAITRRVAEHFGMLGGELVNRLHDLGRPRRRAVLERQRRQVVLLVRTGGGSTTAGAAATGGACVVSVPDPPPRL